MTRLELSEGRAITIKDSLKVRDKRDVHAYSVDGVSADGKTYRFNIVKHQIASAAVRILRWEGITDDFDKPLAWPTGQPFDKRVEAIEGLNEDVFEAITDALSAHDRAAQAIEDDVKNETPAGASA